MSDLSPEREWIRQYAADAKTAARMVLGWHLDALRLRVGLVVTCEPGTPGSRMLPTGTDRFGQNWCVFVKDVD